MSRHRYSVGLLLCLAFASLAIAQSRTDVFDETGATLDVAEYRPLPDGGVLLTAYGTVQSADGGVSSSSSTTVVPTNTTQRNRGAACVDFGLKAFMKAQRIGPGTLP